MSRSSNNSSSPMISVTTPSSSRESLGQQSSLWRKHGHGPPRHEPSSSSHVESAETGETRKLQHAVTYAKLPDYLLLTPDVAS